MSEIKGCMNCGNISCGNNKKRESAGCGRYISPEDKIKELEAQIEKMQNCRNCKKEKIEGACGHFTQVGWCKNWELAD